jgi:hypothetical protein
MWTSCKVLWTWLKEVHTVYWLIGIVLTVIAYLHHKVQKPIYTIRFDYLPGTMLDNGWAPAYPAQADVKPKATLAVNAPVKGSILIEAPATNGYDYHIPRNIRLSDRLIFTAKFLPETMIFTQVELASKDATTIEYKWIKYVPGKGPPNPNVGCNDSEYTLPVLGKALDDGWRRFDISLPDAVSQTWGQRGLFFRGISVLRVRSSLGISPIQFYETRRLGIVLYNAIRRIFLV